VSDGKAHMFSKKPSDLDMLDTCLFRAFIDYACAYIPDSHVIYEYSSLQYITLEMSIKHKA